MNRRAFLGAVGSVASLGTLAYATRSPIDTLEVRVWLSEQAATYGSVEKRILEYVDRVLDLEYWSLDCSIGGTVPVSTEDGARVTTRGEWPLAVTAGAVGAVDIEPAAHVNLLVTDGGMREAPTGYGLPRIASVGGARHIDSLPPFDELVTTDPDRDGRWIVPLTTPARTMQVLVHEIGHALGLEHSHGVAFRDGETVIATPMISTYAFSSESDIDRCQCGAVYPETKGPKRALSLAFSTCSHRELATLGGEDVTGPVGADIDVD